MKIKTSETTKLENFIHYLIVAGFPSHCITKSWTSLSCFIIREEYAHEMFFPPLKILFVLH